jgi:hypothetical protein
VRTEQYYEKAQERRSVFAGISIGVIKRSTTKIKTREVPCAFH